MLVYSLPNAEDVGEAAAASLGCPHVVVEERSFPDGEVLPRVPRPSRAAVVAARLYPEPNTQLVKLMLALDAMADMGAERILLAVPYLPYARQDRRFREGEAISSKAVLRLLASYPVRWIVAVDVHRPYVGEYAPHLKLHSIYPASEYARALGRVDAVVSPDAGSLPRAAALAAALGVPHLGFQKHRDRETGEIALKAGGARLDGMAVALVDDILATGGTLLEACGAARRLGAAAVYGVVTHCQLLGDARRRLGECLDRLICTDSIPNEYAAVRVAPLLASAITQIASAWSAPA